MVRGTDRLDMTIAVDWDVKPQTNQLKKKHFFFVLKMSAFTSAAYIQVHCRLDFIMETNTMNPDCLQYMLPKNNSRRKSR